MAKGAEQHDVRRELLDMLLTRVETERFPSVTDMNLIEELIGPDERSIYVQVLIDKIRHDRHPSIPMMRRVLALA
jgi:hypothetical protein